MSLLDKFKDQFVDRDDEDMEEEEKATQRKYVDVSDVMSSDFPLDLVRKKKAS